MVQEQPDDQGTRAPKDHPYAIDRQIDADGPHHGDGEERDENGLGGFHRELVVLAISATSPVAWARIERPRRPSNGLSARGLSVGGSNNVHCHMAIPIEEELDWNSWWTGLIDTHPRMGLPIRLSGG